MKLLIDECIDRRLSKELKGHFVRTVPQMKWATIKNGELLSLAEKKIDVFLTVDRNLVTQQNLAKYDIAILVLHVPTNRLADLKPLVPKILMALPKAKRRHATHIGI